jgi:7,8-dihydropterin-6-yl-methyl-4-(beta-D-ribofuranosyl)aminobenzene 5'-phosphate synthase
MKRKLKKWVLCLLALAVLSGPAAAAEEFRVTILYDNTVHAPGTKGDWGFACLIEGSEKTILFDTGTRPDVFRHNLETLGIDVEKVDQVVISHEHGDHTGGLWYFLEKKTGVPVFFPASFTSGFGRRVESAGASAIRVSEAREICPDVWVTGEIKGPANELGIILDTSRGLVVITGCAHPGIEGMVAHARSTLNKDVDFVFGGFHLMNASRDRINAIVESFQEAGVRRCGATHCTGEEQIEWFRQAYGENFAEMGVGRVIRIEK